MINYISTRGQAPALSFEEVVMAGLAGDGGLYVPDRIPAFTSPEITALAGLSYEALALRVMQPFIGDCISAPDLAEIIRASYAGFRHKAIAPIKQLESNDFLLELFHGPTLAFKDFALQFLGRVLEYFLEKEQRDITVIGATSGDTGSAAIEGCRGRKHMRIFILHPHGKVSDVQRRQMTSVRDANVFNLAVDGTFDDCQDIVKTLFADAAFRDGYRLTAVNSINWARILAQVVYYFYAALALGAPSRRISFCVPTGNFGDIYAGFIAKAMGLPIEKLIIATNSNDILARCLETGVYSKAEVADTLSPSMNIQVSSNFERLLFDLHDRNGEEISRIMKEFRETGVITLGAKAWGMLKSHFAAGRADDTETLATMRRVYEGTGELLDPHTAVGMSVGHRLHEDKAVALVTLATAHPAKFPEAVIRACGVHPPLPAHMGQLMQLEEKVTRIPNDAIKIKAFIESRP